MALNIGKINLGRKNKRAFFNMSNSVDSTCSAGFVEPTMCLDLIPNTKIDLRAFPGVRLAPLPQPTTGRVKVRTYHSFVHTEDVFEAFENLQSGTSVTSSRGMYTPVQSNYVTNWHLFRFLHWLNSFNFSVMASRENEYTNRELNGIFFNYSISANYDLWTGNDAPVHNLFDDVIKEGAGAGANENYKALAAFFDTVQESFDLMNVALKNRLGFWTSENILTKELFGQFLPWTQLTSQSYDTYVYGSYIEFMRNLKNTDTMVFGQGRSVENADFVFRLPNTTRHDDTSYSLKLYRADNTEWGQTIPLDGKEAYLCIHLTPAGKRLFKIFNALEWNFGYSENVEMEKLLAYYKAWFDIFNPGRNVQWKATNAYNIIHSFYDSPQFSFETAFNAMLNNDGFDYPFEESVKQFFTDLVECYYTEKVDPITVALPQPVANTEMVNGSANISLWNNSNPGGYNENMQEIDEGYGYLINSFGGLSVRFLQSLYNLVNKNSVIGQRVALYMKEHFGIDVPKTSLIDVKDFEVSIVDATATVNNESTQLGEYAGKGIGKSQRGLPLEFEAKKHGYFFQFVVVVPIGGYVQAAKRAKIHRLDWYQSQYDSLGMEPISQYEVNSRNSIIGSWQADNPVFGFRPRYFSFKYKNNLANGGFSFRSERAQFLGYSLDKIFSEPDYYTNEELSKSAGGYDVDWKGGLKFYPGIDLVADEELRYIGKNEQLGNYNRIFYDTTGIVDNYILHIDNDVKMWAPMKKISVSFETYDETSDTDTIAVEHS